MTAPALRRADLVADVTAEAAEVFGEPVADREFADVVVAVDVPEGRLRHVTRRPRRRPIRLRSDFGDVTRESIRVCQSGAIDLEVPALGVEFRLRVEVREVHRRR